MRNFSILLLLAGVVTFFLGFNMDTTVYSGGERVHNLGLMNDRQNLFIFGGVLSVVGALFFAFASKSPTNKLNATAVFDGDRNLNAASYQLYLTKTFNIEKNPTLDKYVVDSRVFASLPEALEAADRLYDATIQKDRALVEAEIAATKKRARYIIFGAIAGVVAAGIYLYSIYLYSIA